LPRQRQKLTVTPAATKRFLFADVARKPVVLVPDRARTPRHEDARLRVSILCAYTCIQVFFLVAAVMHIPVAMLVSVLASECSHFLLNSLARLASSADSSIGQSKLQDGKLPASLCVCVHEHAL
jgi:hypothetical protein